MKKLYVQAKDQKIPVSPEVINKYALENGMLTPFSREPLVGEHNESSNHMQTQAPKTPPLSEQEATDRTMSTAELLDFAQGTDSQTEE